MTYNIQFKPDAKILELGGGDRPLRDQQGNRRTINMDVRKHPEVDIVHDLQDIPWPVESESFDGIFGMYVLEHISWHNIKKVVNEMHRILKPEGKIVLFIPNIIEQCKLALEWGAGDKTNEMLFGSQEFSDNLGCHKAGFSPEYVKELFKEFDSVNTLPHPAAPTDLIIEVYKMNKELFEREYFEEGTYGYKNYRDFATHYSTARIIMQNHPESLLDVGGARGYLVRILENQGVKAVCMDISKHCWHNRATDSFVLHDARQMPWPFKDKEFSICFSINFLEHIEERYLDNIIREMTRVSQRGMHGIHFSESPFKEEAEDRDTTHFTIKPESWWLEKFKTASPDYQVLIGHPRILEYEEPEKQPPVSHMPPPPDNLVKLNLGSFLDMFYDGWVNLDIIDLKNFAEAQKYVFQQIDVTKGLPYDSVDLIISNHLIEHIDRNEGLALLKECYRVMKPKGIIRISTPDTRLITQKYLDGKIWEYKCMNVGVEKAKDEAEAYYNLLLAGHKTIYDQSSLDNILKEAGFQLLPKVTPFTSNSEIINKQTLTTHPSLSVIAEGKKIKFI